MVILALPVAIWFGCHQLSKYTRLHLWTGSFLDDYRVVVVIKYLLVFIKF
jgi:hypothetical protein